MKGAVLAVLCVIALTQGATVLNKNGCPVDPLIHKLLPHSECDRYYRCLVGNLFEMPCPAGLHFSVATNQCEIPAVANCQHKVDTPIDNNVVADSDKTSQAYADCAAAGSEGVLVVHENCNYFYKCNFGLPVAIACPSVTLYDPSKQTCEWPQDVECGGRLIAENIINQEWDPNTGGNNDDPSQASAICAREGSDHVMIAHENCNQFYQCWAGRPVALACPGNLLFNPKNDWCDFVANVDCGSRVIPENWGTGDNNGNNTPDVEDEVPVGNNHDDPSQAPSICAAADSEGVLVAHENCNQFYKCNGGRPVPQICPGILLFDPTKDRCEWRDTVQCGNRVIPNPEDVGNGGSEWDPNTGGNNDDPSQASAICAREGSDHVMIAHENCNQFYQCWAGRPVALTCTGNLLFNPKNDWCDFASNVDCGSRVIPENWGTGDNDGNNTPDVEDEEPVGNNHDDPSQAPSICAAADSEGVLVAHENCNEFYTCNGGRPVAQICPGTLLFDPTKDRCEWSNTVQCGNRVIPDTEDIGSGGNEWDPNTGGNNSDPSQASAICAREGSDNVMIAHENCNQFYQCWAGRPVALKCPENLVFNPKNDWCDFASNVDCSNRLVK